MLIIYETFPLLLCFSFVKSLVSETYGKDGRISRRIKNTALIFFSVVLLQSVFQKYIFHCPEKNWKKFSYSCFFIPAIPLFFIGWLSSIDLQNAIRGVCHGCWNQEKRKRARLRIRWRSFFTSIIRSHLAAYVAPFSWFLMCLLNRQIMTCGIYGPPSLNSSLEVHRKYENLASYSQIIGFDMIIIGTAVLSIVLTIKQCCIKANPGKEICEFECLDNYSSYEADAARKHFEEVMRAAAEENGRRKVQMLLEARKPNVESLKGHEKDMKEMSYEHFTSVRNSLMEIYPRTDNTLDRKLQLYTVEAWHEEAKVLEKQLEDPSRNDTVYVTTAKGGNSLEMEELKDGEQMKGGEEQLHLLEAQA